MMVFPAEFLACRGLRLGLEEVAPPAAEPVSPQALSPQAGPAVTADGAPTRFVW